MNKPPFDKTLFAATLETRRLARLAIRKAFLAQRDFDKSGAVDLFNELQEFAYIKAERAERGFPL